jgi:two-component system, OmpR family, sensor kinase
MRIPGGIRVRLALTLAGIVAVALGVAYLVVVPSLEQRFVDARLDQLEEVAVPLSGEVPEDRVRWPETLDRFATTANARVVAFDVLSRTPPVVAVFADSQRRDSQDVQDDSVALRAVLSGELERGRVSPGEGDYASVALPLESGGILLFRAPLEDTLATVQLVKQRFVLATAFALVLAVVLGLTAAGMLAFRLARLEAGAERIADGDFTEPIVDQGDDEIGQLALAFDRMRARLAQLDNARREFVANASHELRTPLFSLGGFLELLADEELDEETRREFLSTMHEQVERLTALTSALLDLSRLDAGQLSPVHEPVDLCDVARALGSELGPLAERTAHELVVDPADGVVALADEDRVLQIGRALVANALTHTPPGTRVVVGARGGLESRVALAVEDDGPGIPEGQRDAVFERFYRGAGGAASGSGLGLAIAREMARLMHGAVRLESRPGRTVFTLELPADRGVAAPGESRDAIPRENGAAARVHDRSS